MSTLNAAELELLRAQIAARLLAAIIINPPRGIEDTGEIEQAVRWADSLLAELAKEEP